MSAATVKPDAALFTEIATTRDGRDITRPYVGQLRQARDPKLAQSIDWGSYDVVLLDDQVQSTMQQRIGAVVAREWNVIAGDEDDPRSVKAAEAFDRTIQRLSWDRNNRKMLLATFYGIAVSELIWSPRDGLIDIVGLKVRHARRFRYDADDRLRMLMPGNSVGEIMPARKFWVHTVGGSDDDEPYGHGLAHWLYWPTLFKRNGIRFWNVFLDKFGTPTAKGTYPKGASDTEIKKLLAALAAIATDSGFVVPEGVAVEFLNAARSGTGDFHQLVTYMDAAIAKIVLSQTMTTDNGSSRAQGEVHADVRDDVVTTDADDLTDSFTDGRDGTGGPARWWTDFNFGPDVAAPRVVRLLEEEADLKAMADTDEALDRLGWERTPASFVSAYGDGYQRKSPNPVAESPAGLSGKPGALPAPANDRTAAQGIASFAADDPRPLYVSRAVLNAGDILAWACSQGFVTTVPASEMHVTIAYSRRPVNWFAVGMAEAFGGELLVPPGGPRLVQAMGDGGAVALLFQSGDLQWRHRIIRDAGASWDWPSYLPHITLTWDAQGVDLAAIKPWQGPILLGPEKFEPLSDDWKSEVDEAPASASFAAPADPARGAHDNVDDVVDRLIATDGVRVSAAMTGNLAGRIAAASSEAEARDLLLTSFASMDDRPLATALERAAFAVRYDATTSGPVTNDGGNND